MTKTKYFPKMKAHAPKRRADLYDWITIDDPETGEESEMPLLVFCWSILMAMIDEGGEAGIFANRDTGSLLDLHKIKDRFVDALFIDIDISDIQSMLDFLAYAEIISVHHVEEQKFYKILKDHTFTPQLFLNLPFPLV